MICYVSIAEAKTVRASCLLLTPWMNLISKWWNYLLTDNIKKNHIQRIAGISMKLEQSYLARRPARR